MFSEFDKQMMAKALKLAKKAQFSTKPNPAVGCVMCQNNEVVAEGWTQPVGGNHAERMAIQSAKNNHVSLEGATAYVTLEPCSHIGRTPACADGLIDSKLKRVVVAVQDPNPLVRGKGIKKLIAAGIEVSVGLYEKQAAELNQGFIHAMKTKLPFVRLKIASSLDGRTAMANNESKWITGDDARVEVHKMRAKHGAIITGIGTVLADNPSLNVRLSAEELASLNLTTENCNPIRVVLDANLSIPMDAKMFTSTSKTIIMSSKETCDANQTIINQLHKKNVEVVAVATDGDKLEIASVLSYLAEIEEVREVMVESGAMLAGAFIQSGFVQEIHAFIAPSLMGNMAKPMFVLEGIDSMQDKINFEFSQIKMVGKDVYLTLKANS